MDKIRTIDKSRIIKAFDPLSKSEIQKCNDIILETLVDYNCNGHKMATSIGAKTSLN
ncbi:type II toxin-antitoxin system PemK/MazF family toxin [Bizionia gelidisalsuginis]|uniref:type II toxin-antitoxin system PemK/MazF family toxin n=1 Tax=Bizionia gelidisalsuginis TaxID=291188 RepID=UPI001FEC6504|nr:type II toxin-antitoxin system PemK/MazF family toxin [Bizionia gelidisalsuginis]